MSLLSTVHSLNYWTRNKLLWNYILRFSNFLVMFLKSIHRLDEDFAKVLEKFTSNNEEPMLGSSSE